MKKLCLLPAALLCAMLSTVPVLADEVPMPGDPVVENTSSALWPVLVIGVLVILVGVAIWLYLRKKKKQR